MKTINRNAFTEKLIHRYLFESYYFGSRSNRNKLLPKKYHKHTINLVIPESNQGGKYRADFSIIFKGSPKAIPVEVKWKLSSLKESHQTKVLREKGGFLVSFESASTKKIFGVDYIQIDHDDYRRWVSENVSRLTRESLVYQAGIEAASSGNQFWLVYLRGSAQDNFYRMYEKHGKNAFWAFQQNREALKKIFELQRGDKILFILGSTPSGPQTLPRGRDIIVNLNAWFEATITNPYYMELKGHKGTFFEEGNMPIQDRKWPHFIDFDIQTAAICESTRTLGNMKKHSGALVESVNTRTSPASLTRGDFEALRDRLTIED